MDGLNPTQIARRVWSRRDLLFAVAGVLFVFLFVVIMTLTPVYMVSSQVVIEPQASDIANPLNANATPQAADREKVMSEIQILMSRDIAEKVARDLHLEQRSEFNSALDGSGLGTFKRAFSGTGVNQAEIIERYFARLSVNQVGTSRVIAIEFSSYDPVLARDAANHIADLYLQQQRDARLAVTDRAADWLSDQIETLRNRVAESEEKVEAYRAENGLLQGTGGTLQTQQLTELSTQLSAARAAKAEAEARASVLERAAAGQGVDAAAAVLNSPLIQSLRTSEVQLKREISEMSAQLLPTHPRMVQKQAELADLQMQIDAEMGKVLGSVRNEAQVAAAREQSLQRDLAALENRRAGSDRDQIQLRALEREAAANRGVLENFLTRYTEISARGTMAMQEVNARVISRATLPDGPSFPQKTPMLVLASLVSIFGGLLAVFVADLMDHKIRHLNDIEKASGVAVLASVPDVVMPQDEPLRHPMGAFSESIRAIQTGLGIVPAGRGRRGRIIAVTSTARGEGRTTTAVALARSMAQSSLRVLLIDADLRHPDLQYLLDLPPSYGFTDLVTGRVGFREVITRDPASPVHIIPCGSASGASAIRSPRLLHVMYGLVNAYDAIVFDCGPAPAAETQMITRMADHCVYAVRWNATERENVLAGVRTLAASGTRGGIGLVLTRTNGSQAA